jgi:hypothetical protein
MLFEYVASVMLVSSAVWVFATGGSPALWMGSLIMAKLVLMHADINKNQNNS